MAKDFARKSNKVQKTTSKSTDSKKSSVSGALWAVTITSIVAFAALLFYLNSKPTDKVEPIELSTLKQTHESKPVPNKFDQKPLPEQPQMQWEYPKILKEKQIEVTTPEVVEQKQTMEYMMQCASFKARAAAEELKAKIAFLGSQATVDSSVSSTTGTTWYRVKLGPYKTKRAAERKQHFLQSKRVEGCTIYPRAVEKK